MACGNPSAYVYAYRWKGNEQALRQLIETVLGASYYWWASDPATIRFEKGTISDLKEHGSAFNQRGEVRWMKTPSGWEAMVLLDDRAAIALGAEPERWPAREGRVILQPLTDRQVCPPFQKYPDGKPAGSLIVRVIAHPSGWILLSPREFEQNSLTDTMG